jgi:hypothetical protein
MARTGGSAHSADPGIAARLGRRGRTEGRPGLMRWSAGEVAAEAADPGLDVYAQLYELPGTGSPKTVPPGSSAGSPAARGSSSRSARTRCGMRSSPPHSTPACRCATCRKLLRTPTRVPPCATTGPGPASTATSLASSPPTSPEPRDSPTSRSGRRQRPDRPRPETLPAQLPNVAVRCGSSICGSTGGISSGV